MKRVFIVCLMLIEPSTAYADGRTLMFLKGIAYGVAQECHSLQVDNVAIRRTKQIPGIAPGDFYDFMDGMVGTAGMLKRKEETCDSICGLRPGTCYFIKGGS